ncbi:MAG: MBL fold metallo-hydrolase [Actinomycetota bacterium]
MRASRIWQEVGDGIFRRRYDRPFDHNIGVVIGGEAILVVDSRTNPSEAAELKMELRMLEAGPVGWLFNTHYHWDHTFGNQEFTGIPIWGHMACRAELVERGEMMVASVIESYPDEVRYRDVRVMPPTDTFASHATIDLGSRRVSLGFYGRGHTNSDAVLHVDGVTFAGDLVEEGNPPTFEDSFPVDWVETLGLLAAEAGQVVVPGHGDVLDLEQLVVARFDMAWVARRAREGRAAGLSPDQVDLSGCPYPPPTARVAMTRAYLELVAT